MVHSYPSRLVAPSDPSFETAFAGKDETDRMNDLRVKYLKRIRQSWVNNDDYRSLIANLENVLHIYRTPNEVRESLKDLLNKFHDYADMPLSRERIASQQYPALELYCDKDGHELIFKVILGELRNGKDKSELFLAAVTLVEFITIDMYNLRLSYIGDERYRNFQGIVYRGLKIAAKDAERYRRVLLEDELPKRNLSIPLGMLSTTTDQAVMKRFTRDLKPGQDRLHMTIHVHGVDPSLLKLYLDRYPNSVVTSICALPVARVASISEKEILLRGPFFQLISMETRKTGNETTHEVVMVCMNSNRDHTTELSSDEDEKKKQRQRFFTIVNASKYHVCASLAQAQGQLEDASRYEALSQQNLEKLEAAHLRPSHLTHLADARSHGISTWIGGSLPESYPYNYSEQRSDLRSRIMRNQWVAVLDLVQYHYDWTLGECFNVFGMSGVNDQAASQTNLHLMASASEPDPADAKNFEAWTTIQQLMPRSIIFKSIRCDGILAWEVAEKSGNHALASLLRPQIRHKVPQETLDHLENGLHKYMMEKAGLLIQKHHFVLPQVSVLTELEPPEMWIPIPDMFGGFTVRLVKHHLVVELYENKPGLMQTQTTQKTISAV
ncbi:hypothetical protein K461DRAFT_320013 [Myriangium duriaei CBS 260.36]|uniref:Uncharacterized protein n=1 Tax=Myriangium duriaei CBS 260.36 TaxID=1168546 RepID=A0A9P4J7I5_9PEZI|nr:hypothetical protein K461DRAFT_320013 [Myriangium duriaei CBS 260.36]